MPDGNTGLPPDARNDTTRVRQGRKLGVMRWVLLISTAAAAVALAIVFASNAMS